MLEFVVAFCRDYGLFLAKTVTVLAAILIVVGRLASLAMRARGGGGERARLVVQRIDRRLRLLGRHIEFRLLNNKQWKALAKADALIEADQDKERVAGTRKRVYVLQFAGDIRASQVESLRHEITAIIAAHRPGDEVILRLDSPGGVVHGYGLAASQLQRLRDAGVRLVVTVDKIAASGGYLMACVADQIVAAPFAVIGSIGVVAQLPNLHKLMQKHDIDFEVLTAGKFKRTLTVFGENTEEGRAQFLRELDQTHQLFQSVIAQYRPQVALDEVADGRTWYGSQALELGLVDALQTSDSLLVAAAQSADVIDLRWRTKDGWSNRVQAWISANVALAVDRVVDRLWARTRTDHL